MISKLIFYWLTLNKLKMNCSYCSEEAKFKCGCYGLYICSGCLNYHLNDSNEHSIDELKIHLGESRLNYLKQKLKNRLKSIEKLKSNILSSASEIISFIEHKSNQAVQRLEIWSNELKDLLQHEKFCSSEMQDVVKIEREKLIPWSFDTESLKDEVIRLYSKELNYVCRYNARKLEFLNKHVGGFYCGAITSDCSKLVTGGYDTTVRVWNLFHKKQESVLCGHTGTVYCLAISRNGNYIFSGSFDATIRMWDVCEKREVFLKTEHKSAVYAICIVESRFIIVSGDKNGEIIGSRFNSSEVFFKFSTSSMVWAIILSNNQDNFLSCTNTEIRIFSIEPGTELKKLRGHADSVCCASLTSDEQMLVSGSSDKTIIIWDLSCLVPIRRLFGHTGKVLSLAICQNDQYIVSGSQDKTVRVWSILTRSQIHQLRVHSSIIHSILRTNNNFLSLSMDASIGILNTESWTLQREFFLEPFSYHFEMFSEKAKHIGYAYDNYAAVWNSSETSEKKLIGEHECIIEYVEISRDARFAITCSRGSNKNLIFWCIESCQKIADLVGHTNSVFAANFSQDLIKVASGSADQTVRVWNLETHLEETKFEGHTSDVYSIKFLNSKRLLVSAGNDKKVIVWNLIDKSKYCIFSGHSAAIWIILVTENEKFIISGDLSKEVNVWNVDKIYRDRKFECQEQAKSWLENNGVSTGKLNSFLK